MHISFYEVMTIPYFWLFMYGLTQAICKFINLLYTLHR